MADRTQPAGRAVAPPAPPAALPRPTAPWLSWRFLLGALIIVAAYVYGWQLTDINLVQLVTNLPKAQHIVVQMLQPDVAQRATKVVSDSISVVVPGESVAGEPPTRSPKPGPQVNLTQRVVKPGQTIEMAGTGWPPNAMGTIIWGTGAAPAAIGEVHTDTQGNFATPVTIPSAEAQGTRFLEVRFETPETTIGGLPRLTLTDPAVRSIRGIWETIFLALMGTTFSVLLSAPLSFLAARNVMHGTPITDAIYALVRALFNVLRSIEVLIIVVIWAVVVGIGSFAGVLAIAVHGIGALGKLYSESIESIDPGPIEAVRATGATRLQTIMYAVLPQVVPQFVSFTFYRWDINVRMATVIGLVGGGGIGSILVQYMNLLLWRQAATAIWLIIIVVMLMDYASSYVRHKVV